MNAMFSPARGRRRRWVAVVCVCALSILISHRLITQAGNGDTPFVDPGRVAWPLDDVAFRSAYAQAQTRREAAARLAKFPDSVNTAAWLAHAGRTGDALDVLQRVISRHHARIADGLEALAFVVSPFQLDQDNEYEARLTGLLEAARARLPDLDRESAARLALLIAQLDSGSPDTLPQLLITYQGTLAARLAAIDNMRPQASVLSELAEYDAIARREGTNDVAAKARLAKATALVTRIDALARETGNPDPTEPWLEVLSIVRDLESGRYPRGPFVDQAVALVASFSMYEKSVSPGNAARLLEALRLFVVEHQAQLAESHNPIVELVTSKMPTLAGFLPEGAAEMERQFTKLGRELRDPAAASYLKALWLDSPGSRSQVALPPHSPTHEADVRTLFASAAAAGGDTAHARLALARLADRESRDVTSLDSAHAHFEEYLRRFGSGPDAGLTALRLGHVELAQRRPGNAATRFAGVARGNRDEVAVRVLALAYAARASEDAGRFDAARDYYRDAAIAWTPELGDTLGLNVPSPRTPLLEDESLNPNRGEVSRVEVQKRRDELARSLDAPGGAEIERARWLVGQARAREAVPLLERLAREQAGTPAGAEAGRVLMTARLEAAVNLADVSNPAANRAAALTALDAIAKDPSSATAGIAGILGATLTKLQGRDAEAATRMTASLSQWAATSAHARPAPQPGSLESDVLAVRDVVLAGWNQVSPSVARQRFAIAPVELRVKLNGNDAWTRLDVSRQLPGVTNVVFMTDDEVTYLTRAVSRIGGTARRRPTGIMEVPNQPIGDARAIIRWWNEFFPARPGHWRGFDIMTSPDFTSIRFTNAERTRAIVPVVTGYSGYDVILERRNGVWAVTDTANHWVT